MLTVLQDVLVVGRQPDELSSTRRLQTGVYVSIHDVLRIYRKTKISHDDWASCYRLHPFRCSVNVAVACTVAMETERGRTEEGRHGSIASSGPLGLRDRLGSSDIQQAICESGELHDEL